jgi:hypothetical protein
VSHSCPAFTILPHPPLCFFECLWLKLQLEPLEPWYVVVDHEAPITIIVSEFPIRHELVLQRIRGLYVEGPYDGTLSDEMLNDELPGRPGHSLISVCALGFKSSVSIHLSKHFIHTLEVIAHARPEKVVPLSICQFNAGKESLGVLYKSTATIILSPATASKGGSRPTHGR